MKFDRTQKYYCVIQENSDSEVMEITPNASESGENDAVFHFDALENIGKFLYQGDLICEIRIPDDANIINNENKRSYSYISDKVKLLKTFGFEDIINKIKELEITSPIELNISDHKFSKNFVFPERVESLTLTRCHIPSMLEFPKEVNSYQADTCTFNTLKVVPRGSIRNININKTDISDCDFAAENGGYISISNSTISEMMFTGEAESITISDSDLKDVGFAEGTESIVITNSNVEEVNFPAKIEYLFFINSRIGENIKLPQKVGTFRVLGCSYTSEYVKGEMDDLRSNSEW